MHFTENYSQFGISEKSVFPEHKNTAEILVLKKMSTCNAKLARKE